MLSYLDYLVFLHAVFCTEQLYAFRRFIFSMVLRKKKLKITCPFCMGYRLTEMEDLRKNLISRLFGVFSRGFLQRTTLCIPQNYFQHGFAKKKRLKTTCPFCMGYRFTEMEDLKNALISRLFGVFARGFLHRTTLCIPQIHFQHGFAKKKVENNLPILHGLQTYRNGGSSKESHISTIWCFFTRVFAKNNSMHSVELFSAWFCEKKKVENNLPILHGLQIYRNGGSSKCSHISTIWCFCTRFFAQNNSMHSVDSFSAWFCEKKS